MKRFLVGALKLLSLFLIDAVTTASPMVDPYAAVDGLNHWMAIWDVDTG